MVMTGGGMVQILASIYPQTMSDHHEISTIQKPLINPMEKSFFKNPEKYIYIYVNHEKHQKSEHTKFETQIRQTI